MDSKHSKAGFVGFISFSLLLHALLLWMVSGVKSDVKPQKTWSHKPIQARLMFAPVPKFAPAPIVEIKVQAPTPVAKPMAEMTQKPFVTKPNPVAPITHSDLTTPAPKAQSQQRILTGNSRQAASWKMLQRHLAQLNTEQRQRLAEQGAADYQRSKISPDLNLPAPQPFKTEDEKLREKITVRVDCNNTAAKMAATFSTYNGGTLRCQELPDVQKFIDKRLHKKAAINE